MKIDSASELSVIKPDFLIINNAAIIILVTTELILSPLSVETTADCSDVIKRFCLCGKI